MNSPAASPCATCLKSYSSLIHRLSRVRVSLNSSARWQVKSPLPGKTTMSDAVRALDAQIDPLLMREALALLEPAQRILLIAHEHPDGDCIGSALGLAHILRLSGKTCVPACADRPPRNLSFLPGIESMQQTLANEDFDLVIALDAGEFRRFGALYEEHRAFFEHARVLNLDHHISSDGCGQVNIIDPASAATAELLVLFQQQARLPLDRDAAM